jgi:hypothetical protein
MKIEKTLRFTYNQIFVSFYDYKQNAKHFTMVSKKFCFPVSNDTELIIYLLNKQIIWPMHSEPKGFLGQVIKERESI